MKTIKISWTNLFKDRRVKDICKSYACGELSFVDFKKSLVKTSPILSGTVEKIDILGEQAVKHRVLCALNGSGTPITGLRKNVDFLPYP